MVSRDEQVQIGGGFGVPEVLVQSGTHLVEVATTNVTTRSDCLSAFSERMTLILSVHRSNFAVPGLTSTPSIQELAEIKPGDVLLCVYQQPGVTEESLPGEIPVRSHIRGGADLVCFFDDKISGGPQACIIVCRRDLIEALERHPMMRVFRPGRTVSSLLESVSTCRLNGINTMVFSVLTVTIEEMRSQDRVTVVPSTMTTESRYRSTGRHSSYQTAVVYDPRRLMSCTL